MQNNVGIYASQISGHLSAPAAYQGDYWALNTVTVPSGGVSSVTFTGIPQNYAHLQIRGITNAGNNDIRIKFNEDSGNNYSNHYIYTDNGAALVSGAQSSVGYIASFYSTGTTNIFGPGIFDILDYSSTIKNKTFRGTTGSDETLFVYRSGAWYSTAAITSITIYPASGSISANSSFSLYGVK